MRRPCVATLTFASVSSGARPDALTHLRFLLQTRLMEKTGNFSSYLSTAKRRALCPANRASDSSTATAAAYASSGAATANLPTRQSRASAARNAAANPGFAERAQAEMVPANAAAVKGETLASERTLLDTNDASQSRPSTAGSAYRLATSSSYATSPQSSYPSISQLLSSPHHQDTAAPQTPSTSSSNSSPMTPWTPSNSAPLSYSTSPILSRHGSQAGQERSWSGVVLSPISGDDTYRNPRPQAVEAPKPMEPRMSAFYQPTSQTQPRFKSEGWLASDHQRSNSASGWRGSSP
jgi:hypothetical protein